MKNNCDATECYLCVCMPMNPRDGAAWWAAVYEIAQSRTQLKRLSSSSIPMNIHNTKKRVLKEAKNL